MGSAARGRRTEVPLPGSSRARHPSLVDNASSLSLASLLAVVAALLLVPAAAHADEGPEGDVRLAGHCTGGAASELRVRTRDEGELRVDLTLRSRRSAQRWRVIVVHERRLAYRGTLRASRSSDRVTLRRTVPDLFGPDTVSLRASGGPGETCRATATLAGA